MNMRKIQKLITFILLIFSMNLFAQKFIDVSDSFDFQLALNYANANKVDTIYLTTSGGVYTTTDTNYFNITTPKVIMPRPGLAERPIFTHSAVDSSVIEIFRVSNDLTIQGVIFDGSHARTHGMKYALRAGDGPDGFPVHKTGMNIKVKDCIFRNFYQNKLSSGPGYAVYFLLGVNAGTVIVEDCVIENMGDEAIRMTETEKYSPINKRCLDTLIVRNTTFTNIDAECVRFYGDVDTSAATTDAYVLVENITINNSATRTMYIKNNKNTTVRNVIISNGRLPGADRADRADYLIQIQLPGSSITNVDTFNCVFGPVPSALAISAVKGGTVDNTSIFGFDPLYVDAANGDLKLTPESPAYYSGYNNTHLGDGNWATSTPTVLPLNMTIVGKGTVIYSPDRKGYVFPANTNVTLTAVPDSNYKFVSWSGDVTSTDISTSIIVDAFKNVTAAFEIMTEVNEGANIPVGYSLGQNYPNPFNPATTIEFTLKEKGTTTLKLYDVIGRLVATVINSELNPGSHIFHFNASHLASGVYYYKLTSNGFISIKKMMLVR